MSELCPNCCGAGKGFFTTSTTVLNVCLLCQGSGRVYITPVRWKEPDWSRLLAKGGADDAE